MNKRSIYLSIFLAFFVFAIYFNKFNSINKGLNEKQFSFNIPRIITIQISKHLDNSLINNVNVWGGTSKNIAIYESQRLGKKTLKDNIKGKGYILKNINGLDYVCRVSNCNYRWGFYGSAYRNGYYLAVFYNPALKVVKVLSSNKHLDNDLIIDKISSNDVYVKYKKKVFILKIFDFTRRKKR